MTETLLSPSNVLLFGRVVEDIRIVDPAPEVPAKAKQVSVQVATTGALPQLSTLLTVDNYTLVAGDLILVKDEVDKNKNGIYKAAAGAWARDTITVDADLKKHWLVKVLAGVINAGKSWIYYKESASIILEDDIEFVSSAGDATHNPFVRPRMRSNRQAEEQLRGPDTCFARIYGFSYEGTYYELPRPCLFMVHGKGTDAAEIKLNKAGKPRPARAPGNPSLTGIATADFQLADDLKVWSYDQADYTIRMDVETGMFEDILLAAYFGDGGGVSGAKISGAKLSGAKLSGSRISGAKVSGAKLWGGRGDATD